MKNRKLCICLLLGVFPFIFLSCASKPENKSDSIYVMVYDHDNNEVMNVSIYVNGNKIGQTDIYGRFSFCWNNEKEIVFKAEKSGYESIEMKTTVSPGQLIYFKMGTSSYYAEGAESLLDKNDLESALKMINKALDIENRKDWQYLKSIILERINK